jgi:hypothetical protein
MSQEILALRLFRKRGISPNIIRPSLMRQPAEFPEQKHSLAAEHYVARAVSRATAAAFLRQTLFGRITVQPRGRSRAI